MHHAKNALSGADLLGHLPLLAGESCPTGPNGRAAIPVSHRHQRLTRRLFPLTTSISRRAEQLVASEYILRSMQAHCRAQIRVAIRVAYPTYGVEQLSPVSITTRFKSWCHQSLLLKHSRLNVEHDEWWLRWFQDQRDWRHFVKVGQRWRCCQDEKARASGTGLPALPKEEDQGNMITIFLMLPYHTADMTTVRRSSSNMRTMYEEQTCVWISASTRTNSDSSHVRRSTKSSVPTINLHLFDIKLPSS